MRLVLMMITLAFASLFATGASAQQIGTLSTPDIDGNTVYSGAFLGLSSETPTRLNRTRREMNRGRDNWRRAMDLPSDPATVKSSTQSGHEPVRQDLRGRGRGHGGPGYERHLRL